MVVPPRRDDRFNWRVRIPFRPDVNGDEIGRETYYATHGTRVCDVFTTRTPDAERFGKLTFSGRPRQVYRARRAIRTRADGPWLLVRVYGWPTEAAKTIYDDELFSEPKTTYFVRYSTTMGIRRPRVVHTCTRTRIVRKRTVRIPPPVRSE